MSLVCLTALPVESIKWFNRSNRFEVLTETGVSEFELRFLVMTNHNNTNYTCMASDDCGNIMSDTITIRVGGIKNETRNDD